MKDGSMLNVHKQISAFLEGWNEGKRHERWLDVQFEQKQKRYFRG